MKAISVPSFAKVNAALIGAITLGAMSALAQSIPNNTTAGWVPDRQAPASFTSATVDGQTALQTTINNAGAQPASTFYATQGNKIDVNNGGQTGAWSLSGQVDVTAGLLAGTGGPVSTEVWAGTGNPGAQSGFYILGILSGSTARNASGVFNGTPTSGSTFDIWNENTGAWTYLSDSILHTGWNSFNITSDGVGTINYFVDGVDIFTQTGMGGLSGDPQINQPNDIYLEDYNFDGQPNFTSDTATVTTAWNNLDLTIGNVPDGWSTIAGLLTGLVSLAGMRRFTRAS